MIQLTDQHFIMHGMATAHSHAFQRLLRGRTQRRSTAANSFWSWRGLMYELANRLNPDEIYAVARLAYAELAMSGVTAIGEFHYLHHDVGGVPYANRTETAEACIQAALDVGVRICLIRTAYMRGGYDTPLVPAQARFVDVDIELVLRDVEQLRSRYAGHPLVSVAVAAHSIRAVPLNEICVLSDYAKMNEMPFHMHVCEQRRELEESVAEYGVTPIQLLADNGVLSERFVGVHGTHLSAEEIQHLGSTNSLICLCRTTERDLGDGLPQTSDLVDAGTRLCVGVDSHCCENAFEEARAVELDERSRLEMRHAALEAPTLLQAATENGYIACDLPFGKDFVALRRDDLSLVGIDDKLTVDGIIFGATPRAIDHVTVAGKTIVENGQVLNLGEIMRGYRACLP